MRKETLRAISESNPSKLFLEKERLLSQWWEVIQTNTARSIVNPESIISSAKEAVVRNKSLPMCMITCPNWQIERDKRTVSPLLDSDTKAKTLFGEELPRLARFTNECGIKVQLLVILSDIFSPEWTFLDQSIREAVNQNFRQIRHWLWLAAKHLDRNMTSGKIVLQTQLFNQIPKTEKEFQKRELSTFIMAEPLSQLKIEFLKKLEEMREYDERRHSISGLQRIWNRAGFLAALYSLDGVSVEKYFKSAFPTNNCEITPIMLNTVASEHAELLTLGWNWERKNKLGIITPTRNGIIHSWQEAAQEPFHFKPQTNNENN